MRELRTADYRDQERIFSKIADEYETQGHPSSALRYALALITGGHPNTDTGRGYSQLKDIADNPLGLSDPEINLAKVLLEEVEAMMILEAQNVELSGVVSEAQQKINRSGRSNRADMEEASQRLNEANMEIESLRNELQEALNKLDAIKNIEVTSE